MTKKEIYFLNLFSFAKAVCWEQVSEDENHPVSKDIKKPHLESVSIKYLPNICCALEFWEEK